MIAKVFVRLFGPIERIFTFEEMKTDKTESDETYLFWHNDVLVGKYRKSELIDGRMICIYDAGRYIEDLYDAGSKAERDCLMDGTGTPVRLYSPEHDRSSERAPESC